MADKRPSIDPASLLPSIQQKASFSLEPGKSWVSTKASLSWFNNAKGYGFVGREDGPDLFVHYTSIQQDGYKTLREGDQIEFDVVQGAKGPQADQVVVVKSS